MDLIYDIIVDSFGGLSIRKLPFLIMSFSLSLLLNIIMHVGFKWQLKKLEFRLVQYKLTLVLIFTSLGMLLEMSPIIGIGLSIVISILALRYFTHSSDTFSPATLLSITVSVVCGAGMLVIAGLMFLFAMMLELISSKENR